MVMVKMKFGTEMKGVWFHMGFNGTFSHYEKFSIDFYVKLLKRRAEAVMTTPFSIGLNFIFNSTTNVLTHRSLYLTLVILCDRSLSALCQEMLLPALFSSAFCLPAPPHFVR